MRCNKRIIALIAAGVLLISGCANSTPVAATSEAAANTVEATVPPTAAPESTAPTSPSDAEVKLYFEKLASGNPSLMREAIDLAHPGSNAAAYATYLSSFAQAERDAGAPTVASRVSKIDGGYEMCSPNTAQSCADYTNLQHTEGKLSDFYAGDGPLSGRLSVGTGESLPLGDLGTVEFISAYRTIAGDVVIVLDINSSSDGLWVAADYVAPDGRQSQPTFQVGPNELMRGSLGTLGLIFEGAEFGGSLTIQPYTSEVYDAAAVSIPTQ